MSVGLTVEQRDGYTVVRMDSDPTIDDFLRTIEALGLESHQWTSGRVLFDMRSVRTLKSFTDHYAIGEAVGRHLKHMKRMASVVPADRITRASEKTARLAGASLTVFTSEREAIEWLTAAT